MRRPIIILAAAAIAGCARSDSAKDSTAVSQAGAAATPRVVNVTAKDFAFVGPDTIQAGMTTFRLTNSGTTLHHMIIARLDSGKTMGDLAAAMKKPGPPPSWLVSVGGPNAPDPTTESNATFDIAAGNYVIYCMVDIPGGVPHAMKGMIKPLTVVPSTTASAPAPIATDSVTLSDYTFTLSRPLSAGTHTFRVVSTAAQEHEIEIIKLEPGKKAADLLAWMQSPKGPPPAHAVGGTLPSPTGSPTYFTADLSAGDYVLICFLPGPDGKPHFMHGMMKTETIQ